MIRIYGASDDLVEIEGSEYQENEIGCFDSQVRIWFKDGTVILVGYPKEDTAVWWIKVENRGVGYWRLTECDDEDAEIYSDIFEMFDYEIERHEVVRDGGDAKVIPIEEKMPHKVSEVMCVRCVRRWIDVRPVGVQLKDLVCPGCGQTGGVIETGEEIREDDE